MNKLLLILLGALAASPASAQTYKITLQSNFTSGIAYLTHHAGPNLNVDDSAAVSNKGIAVFAGNKRLPDGIYAVVFPGKKFSADFLLGKSQQISIKADTADLVNMQVSGSPENVLFQQYQQYVVKQGKLLNKEREAYQNAKTASDSALHEKNYVRYNEELNAFRNNIIATKPESMMAIILLAMKEPPLPQAIPVTRQDSVNNYQYYKSH